MKESGRQDRKEVSLHQQSAVRSNTLTISMVSFPYKSLLAVCYGIVSLLAGHLHPPPPKISLLFSQEERRELKAINRATLNFFSKNNQDCLPLQRIHESNLYL